MTQMFKLLPFFGAFAASTAMMLQYLKPGVAKPVPHWTDYLHDCRESDS